jgi:hypothetical protein
VLYLFIEIPFTSQIEKLPEPIVSVLHDELRLVSSGKVVTFTQISATTWLLSYPHVKASHTKLAVQGLHEAWKVFSKWKEQILVFHGIIIASENESQAIEEYTERRALLPKQNTFWMTGTAKDLLTDVFPCSPWDGGLWELHLQDQPVPLELDSEPDDLLQLAETACSGVGKPKLILSGSLHSSRKVYQHIVRNRNENNELNHVFYIWAKEGEEKKPFLPLYRAFKAWFDYLNSSNPTGFSRSTLGVMSNLSRFFQSNQDTSFVCPVEPEDMKDRLVNEFLHVLPSQLDQFASGMIIDGWDYFAPELKRIFESLIEQQSFMRSIRLIVITTTKLDTLGSLLNDSTSRTIHGWKTLEISDLNDPFSPKPSQLDETSQLLLDIIQTIDGVGTLEELALFAEGFSINKLLVPQIMKELEAKGFLYSSDIPSATVNLYPKPETQRHVAKLRIATLSSNECLLDPQVIPLAQWAVDWVVLIDLAFQISLTGNISILESYAKTLEFRNQSSLEDRATLEYLIRLVQIEIRLIRGKFEEADRAIQSLEQIETPAHSPVLEGYRRLVNSKVSYILHRLDTAVQEVKLSLVIFQKNDHQFGRYLGMTLYGEIMLAKNKLQDAKEYIQIASRQAEDMGVSYLSLLSTYYEVLSNCSLGFHSRNLQLFEATRALDLRFFESGFSRISFSIKFMWIRTRQLLGDYTEAHRLLTDSIDWFSKSANEFSPSLNLEQWKDLFTLWSAHNLVLMGNQQGLELLESRAKEFPETILFLTDGYFRSGKFEEASKMLKHHSSEISLSLPIIPWRPQPLSGFSFLEDHYIGFGVGQTILENLTMGLTGLISSELGEYEAGANTLFQLCRGRTLAQGDPCHHWYLSWYEQVLEKMNNTEYESMVDDHSTVLGRAIKAMQERSAKIEDPAHRRLFLTKEVVNRTLIEKGRSHNLI